jgi:16S rRNA U516 pseudouridylate synthase RsuA-like enzyme
MDEDVFNIQLRKFLKKVGIQSQREIEQAIRDGIASGALQGDETVNASVRLQLSETGLDVTIEDDIKLA